MKRLFVLLAFLLLLVSASAAWNTDYSAWTYRRPITITNNYVGTLQDVNNVSRCVLDSSALIAAGKMQADGGDSRIAKCNTSGTDADFNISSINSTDTNVWMTVPASIANGATDTDYCLFYGNAAAADYTPAQQPVPGTSTAYVDDVMYNGEVSGIWSGGGAAYSSTRVYGSSSISFDGTNEILYPTNASAVEVIEFWVKVDNAAAAPEVWGVYTDNANRMQLACNGAGGTWNLYATGIGTINQSAGLCTNGAWHHFKMQFGTGGYKVWINGVLTHSGADTVLPSDGTIHVFGCAYWNAACDAGQIQGQAQSFVYRNAAATLWPQFAVDTHTEQPTCALGAEEEQTAGPTSVATVSPNPGFLRFDKGITSTTIDFNSSNTPSDGASIIDTNWYVNSVLYSTDENTTRTFTDWQLDINITLLVSDQNGTSQTDTNLNIRSYPHDLNTIWTPSIPGKNENTDFNSIADSNSLILGYLLENRTDDVNVMDANQVRAFTSSGTKSMRLHVQNADNLSETLDFIVYVSGILTTCIYDENRNNPMPWANAYVNGVAQTLDSQACFTYSLGSLSPTTNTTMTILGDSNAALFDARTWVFDLNQVSEPFIDQNILLCDNNCNYIDFIFYDVDESTLLPNTYIAVVNQTDGNAMASRKKTNASAETTFLLNPNDGNYLYFIYHSTYTAVYYTTTVSVLPPQDELTLTPIGDFNVIVGGLGYQQYLDNAATVSFPILSNTSDYYSITVECGSGYLSRQYMVKTLGDVDSYTIQPYCVKATDGVSGTITTIEYTSTGTLKDVLVVLLKKIPGIGLTTVESSQSDITGTVSLSYVLNDPTGYIIQFWYGGAKLSEDEFRPTELSYTAYVRSETISGAPSFSTATPTIVFSPLNGLIPFYSDTNLGGFDVNIGGTTITDANIYIMQDKNILDYNIVLSTGSYRFDYNFSDLNPYSPIVVRVVVHVGDYNYDATKYFFPRLHGNNVFSMLKGMFEQGGNFGPLVGIWVVVIVCVALVTLPQFTFGLGGSAIAFIVALLVGIGVYFGMVSVDVFLLVVVAALAAYLLGRAV